MSWDMGPGPGGKQMGPDWGPRLGMAMIIFLIFMGLMSYCGSNGG